MTVSNQTNRISAVGSGSVGQEVPFSFPINDTSDIEVTERITATGVPTDLTETTDYTISISGDTGGTLTTVTAIAVTSEIHLVRNTPNTQNLDLEQGGNFNAENVEDAFDKNNKLTTENVDAIGRSIRAPATDAVALDLELPNSVDRAGKNLGFDSGGNVTVTDSSGIFTTQTAVWDDIIVKSPVADVRAFGAKGDNSTDDAAAIKLAEIAAGEDGVVFFPEGFYRIFSSLTGSARAYIGIGPRGSIIRQHTADTPIFEDNTGFSKKLFQGLSLRGGDTGVFAFSNSDTTTQFAYCTWRDIEFYADLTRGISANLIFAHIEDCRFGFLGDVRSNLFIPIFSNGTGPPTSEWTNLNYVENCQFFLAEGGNAAVDLFRGSNWKFISCDFESLKTAAVYALGIRVVTFDGCWFETRKSEGSGADYVALGGLDTSSDPQGTILHFNHCWITLVSASDLTHVAQVGSASAVTFTGCSGNLSSGFYSKKSGVFDRGIINLINNDGTGYGGDLEPRYHFSLNSNSGPEFGQDGALQGNITLWDGTDGNRPGYIVFHSPAGTAWYGFTDDNGLFKIHNAVPTLNSDGLVIVCNENQVVCNENVVVMN